MANVGPIGSVIFTNQMTPAATDLQNAVNNRVEYQNVAAQAIANEKQKRIEELRPTEENQALNPDREHQREEAEEEAKMQKKPKIKEKDEDPLTKQDPLHKLDIRV